MMNSRVRLVTGFLLGGALGLATGLLVAPVSGKQARKKIGKKSKKLARGLAGYFGNEQKFQGVTAKKKNGKTPVEI